MDGRRVEGGDTMGGGGNRDERLGEFSRAMREFTGRWVTSTRRRTTRAGRGGESLAGVREGMQLVVRTNFGRDVGEKSAGGGENGWQGRGVETMGHRGGG